MKLNATEILNSPIDVWGMQDIDQRPDGFSPFRLPSQVRPFVPELMSVMARTPSGVRLRFKTNSTRVTLTCLTTTSNPIGMTPRPVMMNLECGGKIYSSESTKGNVIRFEMNDEENFKVERGTAEDIVFDNLPGHEKEIDLWLTHNAFIEIRGLTLDDRATLSPTDSKRLKWVHYGSSISQCSETLEPAGTWPVIAARAAGVDVVNLGLGGECHLDQFIARTIRDLKPDLISMKIGANIIAGDSMRERVFSSAAHGFLDTLRETLPETPILVISAIHFPETETHPGPVRRVDNEFYRHVPRHEDLSTGAMSMTRLRELLKAVVDLRKDPSIGYMSGLVLFNENDAHDLPDGLHPNTAGYARMGERFAKTAFAHDGFFGTHLNS